MGNTANPNWAYNFVPSPAQWTAAFSAKQDFSTVLDDVIANGGAPPFASPTPWTPADASGAGLTFVGVTASFSRVGNMAFVAAQITFPVTADGSAAKIGGLPIPVPPQPYAKVTGDVASTGGTGLRYVTQASSSLFAVVNGATNAAVTNAQLSGLTINFLAAYPVS